MKTGRSHSPMRAPAPSLGQTLPQVLVSALVLALMLTVLFHALQFASSEDFDWNAALSLRMPLAMFAVSFGIMLWLRYRPLQETTFSWIGFLATFSGLGILFFFFAQLIGDSADYFRTSALLIEQRNAEILEKQAKAEKDRQNWLAEEKRIRDETEAEMEGAIADEPDAASKAAIRKQYLEVVLPAQLKDAKIRAVESEVIDVQFFRSDTSFPAQLWHFLTAGASDQPQDAAIGPALWGSVLLGLITIAFAVPIGIGAALYLEEYKANNWLTYVIQVNINNLAGVPSVVYGLLGGYVFIDFVFRHLHTNPLTGVPIHPANLVGGGMTLALLTLPVVIVAAQEAIRAVPSSIRQGAYALGATRWQVIWHQVLPMSLPGILTGTILSLSRALGEAAPLVMFGALTHIDQLPSLGGRFTVLPLQIFQRTTLPPVKIGDETVHIWRDNAAAVSLLLLCVLLTLNGAAIYFRNRYQKRIRV